MEGKKQEKHDQANAIGIRFDAETYRRLHDLARYQGTTMANVVRAAVMYCLNPFEAHQKALASSIYEAMRNYEMSRCEDRAKAAREEANRKQVDIASILQGQGGSNDDSGD